MLTTDAIARVRVSVYTARTVPDALNTALMICRPEAFDETKRYRTYTSAAALAEDGWDPGGPAYAAAEKYFAAVPAPARLAVSCCGPSESLPQALDAARAVCADFYGVYVCGADAADAADASALADLAAHIDASDLPHALFYPFTGTVQDALAPDGIFAALYAAGRGRAFGLYCRAKEDAAAMAGLAMGLSARAGEQAFALCYKTLYGCTASDLTEADAEALKALNANIYVDRGTGRGLLENGAAADGRRFDETLYTDRIAYELRCAAAALLTEQAGRLPQTDVTSALLISRLSRVLNAYTALGVLAPAAWRGDPAGPLEPGDTVANGYALWADPYDTQPDADRAAHKAMPVHAALTLAGSAESVVLNVNVTL